MIIIIIFIIIIIINQEEEDGGHMDLDSQRKGKSAVIKTSTRQVMERERRNDDNKERKNSLYLILFSDVFFACHWPRRSRKAQTRRPSGT